MSVSDKTKLLAFEFFDKFLAKNSSLDEICANFNEEYEGTYTVYIWNKSDAKKLFTISTESEFQADELIKYIGIDLSDDDDERFWNF